jgi:cyclase
MVSAGVTSAGRRAFLHGAAATLALSTLPHWHGSARAADSVQVTSLGDGFHLISGAGGNVLVRSTAQGRVLVDSGDARFTAALLDALENLPGGDRVNTLFNTHWHLDHVGGNEYFGERGATIIAQETTRQRLSVPYYVREQDRFVQPLPPPGRPSQAFFSSGYVDVDDERIDYGHLLLAHTDGDCFVHFRDANVIAVGDALSPWRDPELDWFGGGWIGGRVDSLELLLARSDESTRFVPGYGPAVGRAVVQAEHALMNELYERTTVMLRGGLSASEMLEDGVMDGLPRQFDDPRRFIDSLHRGLWAHHNKISHDIV